MEEKKRAGLHGSGGRIAWLIYPAVIVLAASLFRGDVTADVYFMELHGKDILAGNLYRDLDFLSMHGWLPFSHQKWAMCLLASWIWDLGGQAAIDAAVSALFACAGLAGFYISNALWPREDGKPDVLPALWLMAATGSGFFVSFRPHVLSGLACLFELWLLERWTEGRVRTAVLCAAMSVSSLACMWLHSTMWYVCLVPLLPYLADVGILSRLAGGRCAAGQKDKRPLLACLACMALAACANPNGPAEFRYVWLCLSAADHEMLWHVSEVQPFVPWAIGVAPVPCVMAWILWAVITGHCVFRKGTDERRLFLWLGALLMMLWAVRLAWYAMLFMWFSARGGPRFLDVRDDPDLERLRRASRAASLALAAGFLAFSCYISVTEWTDLYPMPEGLGISGRRSFRWDHAMAAGDAMLADYGGTGASVFCEDPDMHGMLATRGFRPFMDSRAELYTAPDGNGLSVLEAVHRIGPDREWDGEPLDGDTVRKFADYYGLDYFLLQAVRPADLETPAVVSAVEEAYGLVWTDGVLSLYRVE